MKTLIASIMIISISFIVGSIVVGSMVFEGTVDKTPYETGLQWDLLQKEKESSGLNVVIMNRGFTAGENTLSLAVLDRKGRPVDGASVSVTISRPSTTAYDKTYNCSRLADGSWRAGVNFPAYGYWDLEIGVARAENSIRYSKQVFAQQ